ncbi:MAG: hypothetical protein EAZ89_08470 [Bacteroidetes bacterium]|nr:MAG: hypothetical protein EAZ89_08470 [Bacteroidota bacterium]
MQTYYLRIRKDYAAALIEDLLRVYAVELIENKNELVKSRASRFRGAMTKRPMSEIEEQLKEIRSEWDHRIS